MNKSQQQMTTIYETVSKPVLENTLTVWSPWLKKDIELLERTQDRTLRLGTQIMCMNPWKRGGTVLS